MQHAKQNQKTARGWNFFYGGEWRVKKQQVIEEKQNEREKEKRSPNSVFDRIMWSSSSHVLENNAVLQICLSLTCVTRKRPKKNDI